MGGWDELQAASYAGIGYEIVSNRTKGGSVLDKQQFVGRGGQAIVDRAAAPKAFDYTIDFIEGEYPQTLENLLGVLDAGGVNELVDPFFGSLQAACESWELVHDPDDSTDSARITVHFEVHTDNALSADTTTVPAMANAARSACGDVTAAADAYQLLTDDPVQLQACTDSLTLSTSTSSSADELENDGDAMTAIAIQSMVNNIIARADAINQTISDFSTPEAYALGRSLTAMMFAMETLGGAFIRSKPPIIEEPVPVDTPLLTYVHERYGDSSRVSELFALNSFLDPLLIPGGTIVRRYAF